MQKFIVIGKDGKVVKIHNLARNRENPLKKISPIIEIDTGFDFEKSEVMGSFKNFREEKKYLTKIAEEHFRNWGRCGHFKDAIQITKREITLGGRKFFEYSIDFVGRLEPEKATHAADILPFVTDMSGNLFFIGIIRKENPGKGKFAFIGGKRDVDGRHYETPVETVVHEAEEEAGLILILPRYERKKAREDLNEKSFDVLVELENCPAEKRYVPAKLELVGSYQVAEDKDLQKILEKGKAARVNRKRIYETTAFMVMINTPIRNLTKKSVARWFTAGDDAKAIVVVDLRKEKIPEFAFGHHTEIFAKAFFLADEALRAEHGVIS